MHTAIINPPPLRTKRQVIGVLGDVPAAACHQSLPAGLCACRSVASRTKAAGLKRTHLLTHSGCVGSNGNSNRDRSQREALFREQTKRKSGPGFHLCSCVTSNTSSSHRPWVKSSARPCGPQQLRVARSRLSLHLPSCFFFLQSLGNNGHSTFLGTVSISSWPQREVLGSACALATRLSDKNKTIFLTQYKHSPQSQPTSTPCTSLQVQSCGLYLHLTPLLHNCFVFYCNASHTNTSLSIPHLCYGRSLWTSALTLPPVVKRGIAIPQSNHWCTSVCVDIC